MSNDRRIVTVGVDTQANALAHEVHGWARLARSGARRLDLVPRLPEQEEGAPARLGSPAHVGAVNTPECGSFRRGRREGDSNPIRCVDSEGSP